ncbi:HD domain-containing protein [Luminiphilus sp.]|nr:HD domain-containing protein [Luminiphilus sp.]
MSHLIQTAKSFAITSHERISHTRRYTGEPYWHHLERVAEIVASVGGNDVQVAAAWLHDVVEDTGVAIEEIDSLFGGEVATLVYELTDVYLPETGVNRATRKKMESVRLKRTSACAKTIKLADLLDNSESILSHDKKFAKTYKSELIDLLDVLEDGNDVLAARLRLVIEANDS